MFNNHGKPRLVRFYRHLAEEAQQQILRDTFHMVLRRDEHVCNFLECGSLFGSPDCKLIYRHYATLYFVFCVDSSESELGILDLIQVGAAGSPELRAVGRRPRWQRLSGPGRPAATDRG